MHGWVVGVVLVAGCAEGEPGPDLVSQLTGSWRGELFEADLSHSPVVLLLGPGGEGGTFGYVRLWEEEVPRDYTLNDAVAVEDLGVALDLFEVGGVRRLVLSAIVPFEPLLVGWSATWYCDEEADRECAQEGVVSFDRLEP